MLRHTTSTGMIFTFFAKLFAVAEFFNKVVLNAVFAEQIEEEAGNGVVHNAFINNGAFFGAV